MSLVDGGSRARAATPQGAMRGEDADAEDASPDELARLLTEWRARG